MKDTILNWVAVKSTRISRVAHDAGEHTLYVQFTRGAVYAYAPVTREDYTALISADSVGRALAELCADTSVEYTDVTGEV